MKVNELTYKQFKSTFSEKMNDVTYSALEEPVYIWDYVKSLEKDKFYLNDDIINNRIVELVYRNSVKTYDHVLVPTFKKNIYLVIIININQKNIFGHYLLDLNKEYGIQQ